MATRMQPTGLDLVDESTPDSQRVAVLEAPYRITTARARIPEPGEDQVRVKVRWVGVCGSDVEVYRGTRRPEWLSLPARLGHEVAGVIDKLGAHVRGLAVGDQVICRYIWGGFAEYVVCRPFNVQKLPPGFPLKEASLIEILPGILHAAELSLIDPGTDVLIMGQGVSGLTLTQVISLYSPRSLAVTDLKERNLELARRYGATHAYRMPTPQTPTMEVAGEDFPAGFDVVIPCMTVGHGMIDAVDAAAVCGRIVMYGCIETCSKPFDFYKVHYKRLTIHTTEPRRDIDMRRFFREGVQLVMDGLVNTAGILTHEVPLSRIDQALSLRDDQANDAIHVLVDCEA